MLASIRSAAVLGIAAYDVTVEVDVAAGLPAWTIVGLASSAVKEARERVTAALNNSGFSIPSRRVVCNLSPDNDAKAKKNQRARSGSAVSRYGSNVGCNEADCATLLRQEHFQDTFRNGWIVLASGTPSIASPT
jgi:hypothetical protein